MLIKKYLIFVILILSLSFQVYSYTNISSCQSITSSGEYWLNTSLSSDSYCILINTVGDIILNCKGYTINDITSGGGGIDIDQNNVSILNCNIKSDQGIYSISTRNLSIYNNNFTEFNTALSIETPIVNTSIYNNNFSNPNIGTSSKAIWYGTSEDLFIYDNYIKDVNWGIEDNGGYNLFPIIRNYIYNNYILNSNYSIQINFGINQSIYNNTIINSNNVGINILYDSSDMYIYNNLINGSTSSNSVGINVSYNNIFEPHNDTIVIYNNNILNFDRSLTIIDTINTTIYNNILDSGTIEIDSTSSNNIFYLNDLSNESQFTISNSSNYFNYSHPTLGMLGNFYNDFSCIGSNFIQRGDYLVCTNPNNYTLESSPEVLDYSPLVSATIISTCPTTISSPGSYILNTSISYDGTCISITASNVILDCNAYSISDSNPSAGTDGYAIDIDSVSDVTVKNCVIFDEFIGIISEYSTNNKFIDNNISVNDTTNVEDVGIYLRENYNTTINNNRFNDSDVESKGIKIYASNITTIYDNYFNATKYGIWILDSYGNSDNISIYNNLFENILSAGIDLDNTSNFTAYNNNISGINPPDDMIGFYIDNNYYDSVNIFNNNIYNARIGLILENVKYTNFYSNYINNSGKDSWAIFQLQTGAGEVNSYNNISYNTISNSLKQVIRMRGESHNNTFSSNTFTNTVSISTSMIDLEDNVSNNTFYSNDFSELTINFEAGVNNNLFYVNQLSNESKFTILNSSNYFNYSHPTFGMLGNYYNDFYCNMPNYIVRGDYFVCTNPSTYTLESSPELLDYAPLVSPIIIDACQYNISSPGLYYLGQDVSYDGICINIDVSNVILDCRGYSISDPIPFGGARGFAIDSDWQDNITIKNCIFLNESNAIDVDGSPSYNYLIMNNTFQSENNDTGNPLRGFGLWNVHNVTIKDNRFLNLSSNTGNPMAIHLASSSSNIKIFNNNISNSYQGINAPNSIDNSSIYNNNFYNFTKNAIEVQGDNILIYNNNIYNQNNGEGIAINRDNINGEIYDNYIFNSTQGLYIGESVNLKVYNNIFNYTGSVKATIRIGQETNPSYNNLIYSNEIHNPLGSKIIQIRVPGATNNYNNTFHSNLLFGTIPSSTEHIYLENNATNNTFYNNDFSDLSITINAGATGNTFYLNQLSNTSEFTILNNSNYFNFTHPTLGNLGNYYNDLGCFDYIYVGTYKVCIDPANYTIESGLYDYRPLIYNVVDYVFPTPTHNSRVTYSNFTIRVEDIPSNYNDCELNIDSVENSSTSISLGACSFTYSLNTNNKKKSFNFNISFDGVSYLDERKVTFYPSTRAVAEMPFFSNFSLLFGMLFLLLFFWRNRK